jgi:hypothetical protein
MKRIWGEVEDELPMFLQPLQDVGMFVGGIVVDDDMDRLFFDTLASMRFRNRMNSGMAMALHALAMLPRAIAVRDHGFKLATVGSAHLDIRSFVHPLDSHTRVLQGIPKRIEVLDRVH